MRKSKQEYKDNIQKLVFQYQKNMVKKRPEYIVELVEEVHNFIKYTNAVEDETCKPYIINAMGVMGEEEKCTVAHTILEKINSDKNSGDVIHAMSKMSLTTLYIHSCLDVTMMSDDELKVLRSSSIGQDYIEYSNESMKLDESTQYKASVNQLAEKYETYIV